MSEGTMLKCSQCDWKIDTFGATPQHKQLLLDALTGHEVRHREERSRTEAPNELREADTACPFREGPLLAAFIAGWLARGAR